MERKQCPFLSGSWWCRVEVTSECLCVCSKMTSAFSFLLPYFFLLLGLRAYIWLVLMMSYWSLNNSSGTSCLKSKTLCDPCGSCVSLFRAPSGTAVDKSQVSARLASSALCKMDPYASVEISRTDKAGFAWCNSLRYYLGEIPDQRMDIWPGGGPLPDSKY